MTLNNGSADVSVLGLGRMGHALADALVNTGRKVVVWNRTATRAHDLVARGAMLADSPAAAIRAASVSIMCVLDYPTAVELLDAPGVAEAVTGRTLVQLTSGLPEEAVAQADWVHRRQGRFLAGGIMEFPNDIGKADASILYSGDADAFEAHRGVLAALGGGLQYLGADPRTSINVYTTAGIYMLGSLAMFLELAAVAEGYGIPIEQFRDFTLGTSRVLQDRIRDSAARIAEQRFDGDDAAIDMVAPPLEEYCRQFALAGVQPRLTAAFVSHLQAAVAEGRGPCDIAALIARERPRSSPEEPSSSIHQSGEPS